jgi:very-short-patch-repair endonuclease
MRRPIVTGQRVSPRKVERSRELRREMTPAEASLWVRLRGRGLHGLKFRRQQIIDGFIADFYCHAAGLVIEVDGAVHAGQADYDTARDQAIAAHGLRVLRFTNAQIEDDLQAVLSTISSCAQCEANASPPLRDGEGAGG